MNPPTGFLRITEIPPNYQNLFWLENPHIINMHLLGENCRFIWFAGPVSANCYVHYEKEWIVKWIRAPNIFGSNLEEFIIVYIPFYDIPIPENTEYMEFLAELIGNYVTASSILMTTIIKMGCSM